MDRIQLAEQFRKAVQMFAASLDDEKAMVVATIYDPWVIGKSYVVGDFLAYGVNTVGDPQLYKVVQAHTSQSNWTPDVAPSLYDAIGLDESGCPVWASPAGAHDAYNTGDIVKHNDKTWVSTVDNNVWEPGVYGWEEYEED